MVVFVGGEGGVGGDETKSVSGGVIVVSEGGA